MNIHSPKADAAESAPSDAESRIHHGTFTFKFAQAEDLPRILDFYEENQHPGVYMRDAAIWADRVNKGFFQIVENPQGEIIGATSSYAHPHTDIDVNQARNSYNEVGSTRANSLPGGVDTNGIGHYEYLIGLQGLRIFEQEPPQNFVMADVQTSLTGVIKKLSGPILRWQQFTPEAKLVDWFKASVATTDNNVDNQKIWLMQPISVLPAVAEWLVTMAENPEVEMKRGGQLSRVVAMPSTLAMAKDIITHRALFESKPVEASWAATKAQFTMARNIARHPPVDPIAPDLGIVQAMQPAAKPAGPLLPAANRPVTPISPTEGLVYRPV